MRVTYTAEDIHVVRQRHVPIADAIESRYADGLAIYGAGFVGAWASQYLQSQGAKITKFIDRDSRKIGSTVNGIPVVGPSADELASVRAVFIAARHAVPEVRQLMASYGHPVLSFDGYFVLRNYDRLCAIRDTYFTDGRSIQVFNALLMAMLTGNAQPCLDVMDKDMYFCLPEFSGNFDESYVDAGAFVGDTVERFIWENLGTFRHIHAFEPGVRQFHAMERRMERLVREWAFDPLSVSLVHAGLSDVSGRMACTFVNDAPLRHGLANVGSSNDPMCEKEGAVRVLTLDGYLEGRQVSFIKADVEGMEMQLLRGAERTIRNCRPKMALCIYHYPSHLYEVAEYVRSLVPEYQFALRQHAPLFGDFVLYCWVEADHVPVP
ncbi:MAG: FkbM family methyltransferase [Nitrospira sp.]|nr:FkbM family methyltransferase [Nitrospira sp.]